MIYRVIFSKPAQRDLREIGAYLNGVAGPVVSSRFVDDLIETAESLRTMPELYRLRTEFGADLRAVGMGAYLIYFRVIADAVLIVRVLHGSRNITANMFR